MQKRFAKIPMLWQAESSREHIQVHESLPHQQELLTSIVGLGESPAAQVLTKIGSIAPFTSARQLAAFAGLKPQEQTLGTSGQGRHGYAKSAIDDCARRFTFPL